VLTALDVTDHCRLFPNRTYEATMPAGLDLESQRSRDFAEHWIPRAHGTEPVSSTSYFSGRAQALRELVAWLVSEKPLDTLRVVTGAPGAGKSAILARVVTLSQQEYRKTLKPAGLDALRQDTLPPEGIVDIAIHARGKTLGQIVEIMADKIGYAIRLLSQQSALFSLWERDVNASLSCLTPWTSRSVPQTSSARC
jgi:hypothetical protein